MTYSARGYVKEWCPSRSAAQTRVDRFALPSAMVLLIFVSTIAWATTTQSSFQIFSSARIAGTILLGLTLIFCLSIQRILRKEVLIGLSLWTGAFLYGVVSAMIRGSELMELPELALNYFLTSAMIFVIISRDGIVIGNQESRAWILIAYFVLLYTIAIGGLLLDFPPRFTFENVNREGSSSAVYLYSQGSTKFYGLAAIVSSFAFVRTRTLLWRVTFAASTALFLAVSLLAGGRGDFIAAALVIVIFTFFKEWKFVLMACAGILVYFLASTVEIADVLSNFTFYDRFASLSHSAGLRDVLAMQAVGLIENKPECVIIGCGYNYFQNYYGYESGMYPHNSVLESIVTYGAPLTLLIGFLAVGGASNLMKSRLDGSAFFMIFIFFLIVSMKSGSLISSWYVCAGIVFLITRFICGGAMGAGRKLVRVSGYRSRPRPLTVRR
jgi:O-antigen ligase